ncbi:MAG: NADH-quinone oxidoreductase subunit J [Alphaproteobacteria bacterium]|nr:NADH-quinone oxidoreductase subunit J [Alphaproteobacteria bacterium]
MASLIFYLFAGFLLLFAALVVSVRNPVYAVLFLIGCFFNAAGLFLMMGAEFVAFILLIVYVGAVAVLFLFIVMMLDLAAKPRRYALRRYGVIGGLVAMALLVQLVTVALSWISHPQAFSSVDASAIENTRALGLVLYTTYAYPFELAGLILLVAMIGAIVLTQRERGDVRRQKVFHQKQITVSDAIEIKKVPTGQGGDL